MWKTMSKIALIWLNASILLRERTMVRNYVHFYLYMYSILKFWEILCLKKLLFFIYTQGGFIRNFFFHRAEYMELADKIYTNGDGQ